MIQIRIEKGWLDISPNMKMSMDWKSAMINDTVFDAAYTYPASLPMTNHNNQLLGFPAELDTEIEIEPIPCEVYVDGLLFFTGALGINSITPQKIDIYVIRNGISIEKGEGKLKDIDLGGTRIVADLPTTFMYNHATESIDGTVDTWDYVFFPVWNPLFYDGKTDFGLPAPHKYSGFMNLWDAENGQFWMNANIAQIINSANGEYQNPDTPPAQSNFVPFPYLIYVLRQVANHLGLTLAGDWVNDAAIKRLVIFNTYALDTSVFATWGLANTYYNEPSEINLSNHVPDITISEFLKGLKDMFNLIIVIDDEKKQLRINAKNYNQGKEQNLTDFVYNERHAIEPSQYKKVSGYTFILQHDPDDAISEKFSKITLTQDMLKDDLLTPSFPVDDPDGTIRFSAITMNDQEKTALFFPEPISPASNLKIGTGEEEIAIGCGTLDTEKYKYFDYVDPYDMNNPPNIVTPFPAGITPVCEQIGNSKLHGIGTSNPFTFRLLFYAGVQQTQQGSSPCGTSNIYDITGNVILPYSLKWLGGTHSLYKKWREPSLTIRRGKKVSFPIRIPIQQLLQLDITAPIRVRNRLYYIESMQLNIESQSIGKINCQQISFE